MPDFRLPVLGYHAVGSQRPGLASHLVVSAAEFEQHLDWLEALGYQTVRLEDVLDAFEQRRALPLRAVLLTFDDGYEELASTAFPALRARGMTATVFVVTHRIGDVNRWDAAPDGPSVALLTRDEITHWHAQGIQFGAHTRTHRSLLGLSEEEAAFEIDGSAEDLRAMLDPPVHAFAYPFGHADEAAARRVADTFTFAFSSFHGVNRPSTKRWMLRRSMVPPGTNHFKLRCHLAFGRLPWVSVWSHLSVRALVRFFGVRRKLR